MNLFDLTNQPNGLILGDGFGYPLFSVEQNYTFQYSAGLGRVFRNSQNGVETIKYSTDFASTTVNNIYQITFDILLNGSPDNLGTESKIEFQTTIDNSVGVTFFELPYDELKNLDYGGNGEYTTFTAQYTAILDNESILQIKATEVNFFIENIQVVNMGVEEPDDAILADEIGGGQASVNYRLCLCDAEAEEGGNLASGTNGSFKDDFRIWYFTEGDYDDYREDQGGLGFSEQLDYYSSDIPEMFYPSNCIGYQHAFNMIKNKYQDLDNQNFAIYHDPQICIFGGAELNPEKQNLIGLSWKDFIDNDLFGLATTNAEIVGSGPSSNFKNNIADGILDIIMEEGVNEYSADTSGLFYFNKSGPEQNQDNYISTDINKGDEVEGVKYTYNFNNYNKTDVYLPRLRWWGKQYTFNDGTDYIWQNDDDTKDYSYKTFSDSFHPNEENQYLDDDPWTPTYTTSENIYPIWKDADGDEARDLEELREFAPISTEVLTENFFYPLDTSLEVVYPGKCPPQFQGEENQYGFGKQTLGGFGPVMCGEGHFDLFFDNWLSVNNDSRENPLVKMSSPSATISIETNPDSSDVQIPILANSPDNPTYNFIKEKFIEKYSDGGTKTPYVKYIKIFIDTVDDFSAVKIEFGPRGSNDIYELDLSSFAANQLIPIPDNIIPETPTDDNEIGGVEFREEYGRILFTPAQADFEKTTTLRYHVEHRFADEYENTDIHRTILEEHISGGEWNDEEVEYNNAGYNGNRIYNYGNGIGSNMSYDADFEAYLNGHFSKLWINAGPTGEGSVPLDDGTYNGSAGERRYQDEPNSEPPYYPYSYWSHEWDEQTNKGFANDTYYTKMFYWSSKYTYPFDYSTDSYWEKDLEYFGGTNTPELKDDFSLIVSTDIEDVTHLPWPEQVIGYWKNSANFEAISDTSALKPFSGDYGGNLKVDIFITGTIQFGGSFGIPGFDIDLNPSLDSSYDPFSGIDLRPEIIDENICQHIEIMRRQIRADGDGVFYKVEEHPLIGEQPDEVQEITCDTIFNFDVDDFSAMRARCGDGSTVLMADTGPQSNLDKYEDFLHLSGIDACKYASDNIRSYPNNNQFYFGANLDKRPSLGLFYYEEDNKSSENFTGNLGEKFEQYPNTNLIKNPSGVYVESYDTFFSDNNQSDSYYPQAWGENHDIISSPFDIDDDNNPHPRIFQMMDNTAYGSGTDYIQDQAFDSSYGYFRYAGYDSYMGYFYEYGAPENRGKNPRWIIEKTDYEYKADVDYHYVKLRVHLVVGNQYEYDDESGENDYESCNGDGGGSGWNNHNVSYNLNYAVYGEAEKPTYDESYAQAYSRAKSAQLTEWQRQGNTFSDGCEIRSETLYSEEEEPISINTTYSQGTHPDCHSGGKCLNFNANQALINEISHPYKWLTQWQQLLSSDEATSLFYHDIQSMPDLKASFWMYTGMGSVNFDDDGNPVFPDVEVSVVKFNPHDANKVYHPKAQLNSLSYPDQIAGSGRFKNTILGEWEKFEFNFNLDYSRFYDQTSRTFYPLYLTAQYLGVNVLDLEADTSPERYDVIKGNVYLDDFSVTETGVFLPDVDVRKKKAEGIYGAGSLMEYYDPMIEEPIYYDNDGLPITQLQAYNDTTAPLEAQFYFYPRFYNEQVFDREDTLGIRFYNGATFSDEIIKNDYRRGRFYLYDVDFGDGSPKEYTDKPLRLGNNVAVYHTYTQSGVYEITGYMLRTRPSKNEDGTPNHDEPSGVLHNKKFTVRINVNEGLDEDFQYFGSDEGFSYIPYKNISPVIGGISEESSYYKAIKRQLGFISDDTNTSIYFEKQSDKLKTEIALSKMDSSFNDMFEILPEFKISRYSEPPPTDGSEQGGELIYGGITSIEDELGKTLGNVDLTNIRFFNEPKEIYQMFGFTCDNNQTEVDLIPLGKPEYGLNFSNHSKTFTDVEDIISPYLQNVSKVANGYPDGNIITDSNAIRFGHDFRIDNIEGLGSGQWNHIDGAFVDTAAFNTPDLGYNQTYTYSTHIYIPFGHCEDGRPCSEEVNDYTVQCTDGGCNGTQQYDENADFNVRIVQNMNDDQIGINDWAHDLWHDDIVGGEWANVHDLGTSYGGGNETSFKFKQFDAFNHCHPKGANNPRFKYAWGNGEVFPIRDGQYCGGLDYFECGLTNPSGDADGCYWEGDENNGFCRAANLIFNQPPFNRTCWLATSEEQCEDGCEWYGDGSNNSNYETAISIPHEEIITDEWFRLDFPFTTGEPSEYGNHISLRFDTHLGVNRISYEYPLLSDNLVFFGDFTESEGVNLNPPYLATLPFPSCYEEFEVADPLDVINAQDAVIWSNTEYSRPDIAAFLVPIVTGGLSQDEIAELLGGYCGEFETLGVIAMKTDGSNQCVYADPANYVWDDCQDYKDDMLFYIDGPNNTTPLECCLYASSQPINQGLDETSHTEECEGEFQDSENYKSHKCQLYSEGSVQPIDTFINPTADLVAEVESWELYGNVSTDDNNLEIYFMSAETTAEQYHEYETTTNGKMYKLKYEVTKATTGLESKLLIIAREDGYVVEESIELPTNEVGVQEVMFTSDNDTVEDSTPPPDMGNGNGNGGNGGDPDDGRNFDYKRTLIIGHIGGYDTADSVKIDNVELYETTEETVHSTTPNDGLYTFGAQLLVGDFSGDDLINYTIEDLNPGDCADFQSGNPNNSRYWKNIIPRDYDITKREPLGTEQDWLDEDGDGQPDYYYPVLPKYGNAGTFESANNQFYPGGDYDYPNNNKPFPIEGMVTEEKPQEKSLLINIYNEQDETNVFTDGSGNDNNAFVINDYKPKYNEETSEPQSIKNVDRVRTSKDKGAF